MLAAMSDDATSASREKAAEPEDLHRLFVARANAGDLDGLAALYEPGAVMAVPGGGLATGHAEIRAVFAKAFADRPEFSTDGIRPTIRNGDLALTSFRLPDGGVTTEVARRQPDGTWLWTLDQPSVLG